MKPALSPRHTPAAGVLPTPGGGFLLRIPAGPAGRYRLAQLDDYAQLARRRFPSHPSLTLSLRARASAESIPGTWGFGLWNDPFGLSIGFGGNPWRLPALPNAAWFFHASARNYLSLRNDRPAHGFLAQTFRAPRFHPLLLPAGLGLPLLPLRPAARWVRRLLGRVIAEEAVRLSVDVTTWHGYRLEWSPLRVAFWVDEVLTLETLLSPRPPLGLVIWLDNQFAAFTPEGRLRWGVLENPEAWIEVEEVEIQKG